MGRFYSQVHHVNFAFYSGRILQRFHLALDPLGYSDLGYLQFILGLEVHPALGIGAEKPGETQGGIGGDGPLAGADFVDAALGNADGLGQPVTGDPHRLEEVFEEYFTGVHGREVAFGLRSLL